MRMITLPFRIAWGLTGLLLNATGRLAAVVVGLVFMIAGALLIATVIGAVFGLPLLLFGFALALRGLF